MLRNVMWSFIYLGRMKKIEKPLELSVSSVKLG
jgi:hypothetical protein